VAHPAPQNSKCKNPLENFWDQDSIKPNYQHRVLHISAGALEGHFEGKTSREGHQGGPVLE
jgi:hypothetical protein